MLISLLVLTLIAAGGMALTYLVTDDERFMWRLMAGSIAGSSIFGIVAFVAACVVGFGPVTIVGSLAVTLLPLLLFSRPDIRRNFLHDWAKAKGKLQGGNLKRFRAFAYYLFFFLVFWFFFDRAVFEVKGVINTGASQNLGDLPFHLGAIFGFTEGNNFPPQNPSWAGARFSYPFIADFLTACLIKLGAEWKAAMFVQNVSWAFALLVILEQFTVKLTGSKLAGRLAPALLFFSGGLGFMWFFSDFSASGKDIFYFLMHLPRDYTISDQFRWGNPMVVLFITQRSLLLGMPLTILVLGYLWRIFNAEIAENAEKVKEHESKVPVSPRPALSASFFQALVPPVLVGLLAGTLVLIHLHSLVALFIVTAFLFVMRPVKWREWVAFGVGVTAVAVPEMLWSISGSATETKTFFDWNFGWDKGEVNFVWFWLKNTGIVIPALVAGIYLLFLPPRRGDAEGEVKRQKTKGKMEEAAATQLSTLHSSLLLFYIPFALLFLISNTMRLAPSAWDNIKILIYWYIGSIPLIAWAIVWAWQQGRVGKIAAVACFMVLIFAGSLDVWRTASAQINNGVFQEDAVKVAEQIKSKTAPNALFLNAPTYNSAVVLSGRQSLMRYSGHLASHGIDYGPRESDVKQIYEGGGVAEILLKKYNIDYVLISPVERNETHAREEFFKKYPIAAESGDYKVYKIR